MELDRKEFHFDLDVDSLKRTYSDHDSSSWNAAWSDIRELLEEHGFEKPQYSGYESVGKMSYLEAYHVIDILSDKLPWFSSCMKAATFTEIGDMKSATAELSKRNGSEPPKDLNKAH